MTGAKGQALVESALMLPLLGTITAGFLFSLYFMFAILWSDHWLYRANMCLIEGNSKWACKSNFNHKMQVFIPQRFYEMQEFWITRQRSFAKVQLQFFTFTMKKGDELIHKSLTSSIRLPLASVRSPTTADSPWFTSSP